jgi:hypothetical protein
VNFSRCHIDAGVTSLQCSQFAFFVGLGRLIIGGGWVIAVLVTFGGRRSQTWLFWKLVACILSSVLYLVCMFVDKTAWEIVWFFAIGIDVVLLFVPNSFVWMDDSWPRFGRRLFFFVFGFDCGNKRSAQATEDRFGMVHVVSLAEVAIAIILPRGLDNLADLLQRERFTDVALVLALVFVLALWEFVVCESSKSLALGQGAHALVAPGTWHWLRKSVWMLCQFCSLTGVVVMALVARTIGVGEKSKKKPRVRH